MPAYFLEHHQKYIDGGVVSLVPIDSARDLGADIIIAVDVTKSNHNSTTSTPNSIPNINSFSSFWGFLENNITAQSSTTHHASNYHERDRADIIITPDVGHISSIDTSQRSTLITAGSKATTPQINAIKQLIKEKSQSKYATL
ncbi:patatin-like phospholipase family protein [Psychrobacter sp. AOP42-A1-21]|uniref:patatin-like phospholipase family protein n=2 Tax=unclassified Psychrobacter TaxID=196806 RepID=UPI001CE45B49|nr:MULTISPECIES: hypothetical protein [unclassified Psychrobacter]